MTAVGSKWGKLSEHSSAAWPVVAEGLETIAQPITLVDEQRRAAVCIDRCFCVEMRWPDTSLMGAGQAGWITFDITVPGRAKRLA